jgi:predicted metal-dependent RNase
MPILIDWTVSGLNLCGTELAAIVVLASTIDFISFQHGHLRSLRLPRLVDQGFKGKIYCSGPTKKLQKLIL